MPANCSADIRKLGSVRNFIQVPDAKQCGKKTYYYGKNAQMMEVDSVQQDYRAQSNPIRSWDRYSQSYVVVGNQEQPPDAQTFTVRFYETCGNGVPLPHTLRDCRVRIVNNHGLCKTAGDITGGWSHYQEIIDGIVLSENRGRRTSYDAADDALVNELTLELVNLYDVSTVYFSALDLSGTCADDSIMTADDGVFDCSVGCGDASCGCRTTCNDGTNTIYIGTGCADSTTQNYLWYTRDGGETSTTLLLPVPAVGAAATYPKVAINNGRLYVLAYKNPPTLYSIALDEHGEPTGSWTEVAALIGPTVTEETNGTPGKLVADQGQLHIMVQAATGARYYTLGDGFDPLDGPRMIFSSGSAVKSIAACGDDLYAVGAAAYIEHSIDGGETWAAMTVPVVAGVSITTNLNDVAVVGVGVWIVGASGAIYRTTDNGASWTNIKIGSSTGAVTDITFNGDNIGWAINAADHPLSTVLGGELADDWTNIKPRIDSWTTGVIPVRAVVPTCAKGEKGANTVLVFGINGSSVHSAYLGRSRVSS